MAEDLGSEEIPEITVTPPSTPISSSMPLQLSGFLSGDNIQVEGDTGNLHFSVKFNIHNNKYLPKNDTNFDHFPNLNSLENNIISCQNSSFSSYMTPKSSPEIENQVVDLDNHHGIESESTAKSTDTRAIMTRLRSGAVSQVNYFPRKECKDFLMSCGTSKKRNRNRNRKKREKGDIVSMEKLLQRRSFPVRPCSSYVFFVMSCWGSVKSSSFGQASKRLSQMWCKLPLEDKKVLQPVMIYLVFPQK